MWILWKHILRAHLAPFLFSAIALMGFFVLQFIMKFMDQLVGKGLSAGVITEVIVLNLAWMLVLAVPMSVLVATLMAFGGMASANEVTAMRAHGISLYRMVAPPLLMSAIIALLLVVFNNDVLPDTNYAAKMLTQDIYRKKPTFAIIPGLFSQDISGYTILARKTYAENNELGGVTIFDHTNADKQATVTARRGVVSFSPDYRKLIMDLYDGEIHEVQTANAASYRTIRFERHRIAMDAEGFDFQRQQESAFSQRGDRELSAADMQARVDSIEGLKRGVMDRLGTIVDQDLDRLLRPVPPPTPLPYRPDTGPTSALRLAGLRSSLQVEYSRLQEWNRKQREYQVEIHKKYAIPAACVIFILIGAPLGIMARRGTFGTAASLSLGFFLLYWACLIGGEKLADRGFMHPWLGMWGANIILGVFGIYLTVRSARESLTIDWSRLRRFVPRSWLSEEPSADQQ
jgi:lipopolysaccharide export system permease protein